MTMRYFSLRGHQTPPQLKDRRLHRIRLNQADTKDADGVRARGGQGEGGGEGCGGDEAGLEEDLIVLREDDQPQIHVAGDAGVVEVEGVTGGGVQRETEDFVASGQDAGHGGVGEERDLGDGGEVDGGDAGEADAGESGCTIENGRTWC